MSAGFPILIMKKIQLGVRVSPAQVKNIAGDLKKFPAKSRDTIVEAALVNLFYLPASSRKLLYDRFPDKIYGRLLKALAFVSAIFFSSCHPVPAMDQPEAVKALYGEACGEPYEAKLAVASVMRNRIAKGWGLRGIYGGSSKQLQKINPKAWTSCTQAWSESLTNNTCAGSLHFGGKLDDKYFAKQKMKPIKTIGNTRIYK